MKPSGVGEDTIVEEIAIRASAEKIFDALTRSEELLKWWCVEGKFQLVKMECDLRPGGKWRMHLRSASGGLTTVAGVYRRIERPKLLEFTWIREQEDSTETLVRWDLEEKEGTTSVRVTHSGLVTEGLRKRNDGWAMIVKLLQAYAGEER